MYKAFRFILPALLAAACCGPKDGEYSFHILTSLFVCNPLSFKFLRAKSFAVQEI